MFNVKCNYCGKEFSEKVFPHHLRWCRAQKEKMITIDESVEKKEEYTEEDLRKKKVVELYQICIDNKIKVPKKQTIDFYIKKILEK